MKRARVLLFALFAVLALAAGEALAKSLVVEETFLQAVFAPGGPPTPLEALIVRPADTARHPLAVICHGTPRERDRRQDMAAIARTREAEEFARRGFAVLVFLRRGYGTSGGGFVEGVKSSSAPDYAESGLTAAEDIREAIRLMKAMPYVDPNRILVVGQSAGGLAAAALASNPPAGLKAVICFAPGKGSTAPDEVPHADRLVNAFLQYGRTARVPALFVYSENDHYFGPDLARRIHAAFNSSGGRADFIMAPPFGEDGHGLFSPKGIPLWTPYVDAFLAAHALKLRDKPLPLDRVSMEPPRKLSAKGKSDFKDYLEASPHKAFVMDKDGAYGWSTGKRTIREAVEKATGFCQKHSSGNCEAFMMDDNAR